MTYQWIIPLIALLLYGALLAIVLRRREWRDVPIRRLAFYLVFAMLAQAALLVSLLAGGDPKLQAPILKTYSFVQIALPLSFYAFARPFIRAEQRPWAFLVGLILFAAAVAVDLLQISLDLVTAILSATALGFILQTVLWVFVASTLLVYGVMEYARAVSPLHRNRIVFLFLALPFFIAHDAVDLIGGESERSYAPILQAAGVLIFSYAILRHNLVDLRDLMRRSARNILVTIFGILAYGIVIGAALYALRGVDVRTGLLWAAGVAAVLAILFQPARNWVEHAIQRLFYGRRSDVPAVVQNFSLQLAAQIELNDLAAKGSSLLKQAVGARDAALLLVSKEADELRLSVVPSTGEGALTIHLDGACSVARELTTRDAPMLQYDIDRLPQFADLSPETRGALQHLGGEALMPIRSRGALIGIWVIGVKVSGDRYDRVDLELLTTLAGQSAVALENARLLADLRDQMLRMSAMRDYLDSTLTSIATGVITIDPEGKIASFNRAAQDIFRIPAVDALGREYEQVLPPMEGAQLPLLVARLWAHSSQHLVRDVITTVPGRGEVHLTLELSGFRRGQEMVGVVLVVEDETEQARLETERRAQEQETLRVRSTFEHYVAPWPVSSRRDDPEADAARGRAHLRPHRARKRARGRSAFG